MSLLRLRNRLKTVRGLNSILSALQVVTIVRSRKIKEQNASLELYLSPMRKALSGRLEEKALSKKVLVVVASNRGLCGGFNASIALKALEFAKKNPNISLVILGKNGL